MLHEQWKIVLNNNKVWSELASWCGTGAVRGSHSKKSSVLWVQNCKVIVLKFLIILSLNLFFANEILWGWWSMYCVLGALDFTRSCLLPSPCLPRWVSATSSLALVSGSCLASYFSLQPLYHCDSGPWPGRTNVGRPVFHGCSPVPTRT